MLSKTDKFQQLLDIMDELREKCPWDRVQTNETLRTLTIEETHELSEAIMDGDNDAICKELGDLLLHVVFYARLGQEKEAFDINTVIEKIVEKLIFRHPHVYGNVQVENANEVVRNWEQLKTKEVNGNRSVLAGVPASLPALIKANRIQEKARGVGFDWEDRLQVWDKIKEELHEVQAEAEKGNAEGVEEEFGDLLFSVINAARLYSVNPENALEKTNRKFIARFNYLEEQTIKKGRDLKEMTLAEMDLIWNEAKKIKAK